jgi:hypothetical protein
VVDIRHAVEKHVVKHINRDKKSRKESSLCGFFYVILPLEYNQPQS